MPLESSHGARTDATETRPPETTPRHVLIVEDDEDLAELLCVWTRDCFGRDARIRVAHSVADGRTQLDAQATLDVVLLDRQLPDGPGRELLDSVTSWFDTITLMITAVSPESDIIDLPIDDYLVKPIDKETLVTKLSLLEKLDAATALAPYTDSRKASLLEFHLDAPEENPLFRRFAARWPPNRLEIAVVDGHPVVYELYTGGQRAGDDREIHVSIAGTLAADIDPLLKAGEIEPVGELLPSGDDYALIQVNDTDPIESNDGAIVIYDFTCETPERYVTDDGGRPPGMSARELTTVLESALD
ncbi:response regulator [Natrinema sp. SYSU A 869]|uniref:response regulator transcription factor n=1 Tax=Natrinema sp. SYSU A 869 TaxID=2871694 RepID=UPI001CA3F3C6|nr:response regulator [Natrinema sp. SYSU A 869]